MTTIGTLIIGAVVSLGALFGINSLIGTTPNVGGGTGTINQLQQFVATTSPVSAITQAVFGKSFRLSGQSTGCAQFDSNGVLTSSGSACGGGGLGWASTTVPDSNSIYSTAVSNVGIGTTSPWTTLSVVGSTTIAGGPLYVLGSRTGTGIAPDTDPVRQYFMFRKDANDYTFGTIENRDPGANASADFIFNNNRTTAVSYFGNFGYTSSGYNNPVYGNANVPNAFYDIATDGPRVIVLATTSSAGYFDVTTGGYSSSRMRITSTGNVGVGTTTPNSKLHVLGDAYVTSGWKVGTQATLVGKLWNNGSGQLALEADSTRGVLLGSNSFPNSIFINGSTGNVGIGTTSPGALLDVYKSASTGGHVQLDVRGQTTGDYVSTSVSEGVNLRLQNYNINNGGAVGLVFNPYSNVSGSARIAGISNVGGDVSLAFQISNNTTIAEAMRIDNLGNIGIGTTTPQSTLSVGSVNDATNSYAQIDSVNGAPTAGDCDTDIERGRMIIDYSNNRFYICNGATRGWDYSALTD